MKAFPDKPYAYTGAVSHQGYVIVLASKEKEEEENEKKVYFYYRVLNLGEYDETAPLDEDHWAETQVLSFPIGFRLIGMNLVNIPKKFPVTASTTKFMLFSDQSYVYLFRRSDNGTIYMNRFVFNINDKSLQPAWETRYRRSEKTDYTDDKKDNFGSTDMDGHPFLEPTYELAMIKPAPETIVGVALTDDHKGGKQYWNVFSLSDGENKINVYRFIKGNDGIPDLSDKKIDETGNIPPDRTIALTASPIASPVVKIFTRQEVLEGTQKLKRSIRLMLAFPVDNQEKKNVAVMDLAVANDGKLAQLPGPISLEPLERPTAMPLVAVDGRNLTVYGAILNYVTPNGAVSLTNSSDGNVYLYCREDTGATSPGPFIYTVFSTDTSRAIYNIGTTAAKVNVNVLARHTGTIMNHADIRLEPSDSYSLCTLILQSDPGIGATQQEKWHGLPTGVDDFQSILNGEAFEDIFDPQVQNGSRVFYDYSRQWRVLANPLLNDQENVTGTAVVVQTIPLSANPQTPLEWQLEDSDNPGYCNVSLSLTLENITIKEDWKKIPKAGDDFVSIINGKSKTFDYKTNTSVTHPVCKTWCGSGFIWFISIAEQVARGKTTIEKISSEKCTITLQTEESETSKQETWPDMPRSPGEIVNVINGNDDHYDYSKVIRSYGTGEGKASKLYRCFAAAPTHEVETQRISCTQWLQGSSLLAIALRWGQGKLGNRVRVQEQGVEPPLTGRASAMFSFRVQAEDDDLQTIFVTAGHITREQEGKDSAWLPATARSSLDFRDSAVTIDAKQNLNIQDNLSMEAWIYPQKFSGSYTRIFHHAPQGTNSRFALGLVKKTGDDSLGIYAALRESAAITHEYPVKEEEWAHIAFSYQTGYSLQFDGIEYIDCGNGNSLNMNKAFTIETWVKAHAAIPGKRILVSRYGGTANHQSYQLSLENNMVVFRTRTSALKNTPDGQQHREIVCSKELTVFDRWVYIAAVAQFEILTEGAIPKTIINACLYINDQVEKIEPVTIDNETLQVNVSVTNFTIGGIKMNNPTALEEVFNISEVRLWNKALSSNAVLGNCRERRVSEDTEGLVSYWKLNEGEGRNATDTMKLNNGLITSARLWQFSRQGAEWNIYVNGQPKDVILTRADTVGGYPVQNTYLGTLGYGEHIQQSYAGLLDEVRIWNRSLRQEEILDCLYASLSGEERGLEAYWRLNEGSGKTVEDASQHGNKGEFAAPSFAAINTTFTLKDDSQLSVNFRMPSTHVGTIYSSPVDGKFKFQLNTGESPGLIAAWQDQSYRLTIQVGEKPPQPLENNVEFPLPEVAMFDTLIAVTDRPIKSLSYRNTSPKEPGWNKKSAAPVAVDAPWCREIPGSLPQPWNQSITGRPLVVEYGDVQKDSEGNLLGIMKRSHIYMDGEKNVCLQTSFKVGETEMQYVGQVQTRPTLIGFIEGAPPVPSENLTKADDYVGTSSLELAEQTAEVYRYSGSSDSYLDMSLESKLGVYFGTETKAGVGVSQEVLKLEGKMGIHVKAETSMGWLHGKESAAETDESFTNHIDLRGSWETEKDYYNNGAPRILNPQTGQRYLPDNMGYGLVKSGTADLFAMRMRITGAVVSYVVIPNKEIPRDWNIIMFPLNPAYVKNGTLDGMVGLVTDPNYPSAIYGEKGSYFKPVEAYALKQAIDQEKETTKTYFTQRSTNPWDALFALDTPTGELLRDWDKKQSNRSLVNTYVWTAQGGFYAEEEQFQDIKQVSHGGTFKISAQVGIYGELSVRSGGIGGDFEADVLFGPRWEGTVVSTEEYRDTFSLNVNVTGEGSLNQWNPDSKSYENFDCPGKVDSYRFMTFYLAPSNKSFSTFFNQVVDPNWLNKSNSPNALALQQAEQEENAVWRVLHRVTFVSRVPPEFKSSPDDTEPINVARPVNIDFNAWFIDLVKNRIGNKAATRGEIDTAVDNVLDTDLKNLDIYWAAFLKEAKKHPEGYEAMQLLDIRGTAKAYMNDYYETLSYLR